MEGLVNYSSEDEQDDYPYSKGAVRERGGASGRSAVDLGIESSAGLLKRRHERSRSKSPAKDASPYRKGRDAGGERLKYNYDEDKYKTDKRATDKFGRDHREKRDGGKEARSYRDTNRDYDNGHKHDYRKHDDHKRYRDHKRDLKRDDYYKDDKRYNRYDDKKPSTTTYTKERFNSSKPRYDRKPYDERPNDDRRLNDERRSGGPVNLDDRRKDYNNDRRNYDDDKSDRRNNDDKRGKRSYNEDRSNTYRPRRSASPSPAAATSSSRNSNNKYEKDDYNSKRERKHRSRSRSPKVRSRSNSAEKTNERDQSAHNNSQRGVVGISAALGAEHVLETRPETEKQVSEKKPVPTARNFEALLSLPLSETAPKHPSVLTVPPISTAAGITAAPATVQLPSYYNPNVINPNKYAEQVQKRKLIWGAKKVEDSASKWGHAQFSQDQDGKVASKFMRLMGIKSAGGDSSTSPHENDTKSPSSITTSPSNSTDVKSREAMFSSMEQQYEVARQVTHTMRGVGLGFGSQPRPY